MSDENEGRIETRLLPSNYMSESIIENLKVALRPEILDETKDRFHMGVEYQKANIRLQLNTLLNQNVF